jgi:hypothetical protein
MLMPNRTVRNSISSVSLRGAVDTADEVPSSTTTPLSRSSMRSVTLRTAAS